MSGPGAARSPGGAAPAPLPRPVRTGTAARVWRRALPAAALVLTAGLAGPGPAPAAAPSFDCARVEAGSIAARVCASPALSALDRRLAEVYAAARARAAHEHPPRLAAEQRGWIKGRDDCWKAADATACVHEAYRLRTAELQARYSLLPGRGPVRYACRGNPADEVTATFFDTDPPTARVERGDQVSLMFQQPAASGARYAGRNESLWEHQGQARVRWGHDAEEMTCLVQP